MNIINLVFFRTLVATVALRITVGFTVLALSITVGFTVLAPSTITTIVRVINVLSLLIGIIRDTPNVCVFNTVSL